MKTHLSVIHALFAMLLFTILFNCKKEAEKTIPLISQITISDVTATTATSAVNITSDGGAPVINRGVCWSTGNNPTISDSKTSDGAGTGSFTSTLTGLLPETTYYVKSYATNSIGTSYGTTISFKTSDIETLLQNEQAYPNIKGEPVTISLDGVPVTCLKINGEIIYQGDIILGAPTKGSSLNSIRYLWPNNTVYYVINSSFPKTDRITNAIKEYETKTNLRFKQRVSELNYVQFIWDSNGCSSYLGMIGNGQPIRIADWGNAGTVVHELGHAIGLLHEQSKKGRDNYISILWENIVSGMEHNFDEYSNSINTSGFDFNSIMLYHSWGFSKNGKPTITKRDGSTFNAQRDNFSSQDLEIVNSIYPKPITLPTITTTAATTITTATAISGGSIASDGGATVTARGVCWSTSANPTTSNSKTTNGTGTGSFTSSITGLSPNTTYYVRAYATNSVGTAYGSQVSFSTDLPPTVTTDPANNARGVLLNKVIVATFSVPMDSATLKSPATNFTIKQGTTTVPGKFSYTSTTASFKPTSSLAPFTVYTGTITAGAKNSLGTPMAADYVWSFTTIPQLTLSSLPALGGTTSGAGLFVQGSSVTVIATANPGFTFFNWTDGATVASTSATYQLTMAGNKTLVANFTPRYTVAVSSNPLLGGTTTGSGTFNSGTSVTVTAVPNPGYTFTNWTKNGTAVSTTAIYIFTISGNSTLVANYILLTGDLKVTDADGNVYSTVTIGTQTWFVENLKTTKYNDGTAIPLVTDNTAWYNLTTPAYCWYNNDAATNKSTYGALYNWYTVNSGKLCPSGWHVPSDTEWTILTTYLGGEAVAGGKLKETGTIHWNNPNAGATNSSGFTALPGGGRFSNGIFSDIGTHGDWWSSVSYSSIYAWSLGMSLSTISVGLGYGNKPIGLSVRCIKD